MSTALTTSIALCTYNGERFLQAQLDSLLAQTRLPDQIVVFDDASQDGSWTMLETFAQQARQRGIEVLLRRQPANVGYVRNFEAAMAECGGEIVFLCDQDDVWHADKIQRMAARFEAEPGLTMLHTDARLVDADGHDMHMSAFRAFEISRAEIRAMHAGRAFDVLLKRNIATGATMAVRRCCIGRALPVPDGWIHDEWLAMVGALVGQGDVIESQLIDYRQHAGNQVGVSVIGWWKRISKIGLREAYLSMAVGRVCGLLSYDANSGFSILHVERRVIVERWLRHLNSRANLPGGFLSRISVIRRELVLGNYRKFSSGWNSVISDFFMIDYFVSKLCEIISRRER